MACEIRVPNGRELGVPCTLLPFRSVLERMITSVREGSVLVRRRARFEGIPRLLGHRTDCPFSSLIGSGGLLLIRRSDMPNGSGS
jgi:hypothetical protein